MLSRDVSLPARHLPAARLTALGAALCVALGAACARQPITVVRSDLLRAIPRLQRDGRAEVPVRGGGTYLLSAQRRLTVPFSSCALLGHLCSEEQRTLTVAQLLEGCPVVAPFAGAAPVASERCLLLQSSATSYTVDTRLRSTVTGSDVWAAVGGAVLLVGVLSLLGYIIECAEPDDGC